VAFKIRRLIGDDGVRHGVRLVEGVVGKIENLVVDARRDVPGDAVADGAADAARGVPVDKRLRSRSISACFFLDIARRIRSACPSEKAAQPAEDLDDLLLVDDAAVGDLEDCSSIGCL
jgi:hypothetical protein